MTEKEEIGEESQSAGAKFVFPFLGSDFGDTDLGLPVASFPTSASVTETPIHIF